MVPIRDNNPTSKFAIVTVVIILLNIVIAWFQFRDILTNPARVEEIILAWALIPARDYISLQDASSITSWVSPYFSSMFMHGGIFHLLANMWSLWIFGDNVENEMGRVRYLMFYLLAGLGAALTHSYLNPYSVLPVVGASGAISGVMGAYLLMFPTARLQMFTLLIFYPIFFEIPAVVFLIIWFLGQVFAGAGSAVNEAAGSQEVGGIAFAAHIGGFITGMILLPFFRKGKGRSRARRSRSVA
jgi:membrane associated rhomboid family serine protease